MHMQDAAASIDPAQCRLPPGRLPIAPSDCAHLIDGIRAHGQRVPGLIRRTPPGDPVRYEIICGARRHFAITTLGQNGGAARPFFAAADRNLCVTEKGWQKPTPCDTTTTRHAT
jgi:hypothetical protein